MGDFIHVHIKIFKTNLLIYERPNTLLADLRRVEPPPPPGSAVFFKFMRVKERRWTDHRALCSFGPFCIPSVVVNSSLLAYDPGSLSNRGPPSRLSEDRGNQPTSEEMRGGLPVRLIWLFSKKKSLSYRASNYLKTKLNQIRYDQ